MSVFYEKGMKFNWRNSNGVPYYRISATINGKRKTFYGKGEKDAKRQIEEAKMQSAAGLNIDYKNDKVGRVFEYWLFNVKRTDGEIKASTFARYDCAFRNYIKDSRISNLILSKLDSATMQAYVNEMYEEQGCTSATIRETVKVWRMFFTWAADEGYLIKNPCRKLSIPGSRVKTDKTVKTAKALEIFSQAERTKLLEYMTETHYAYDTLIILAFATGMREGELLGLMWKDIEDDVIHITRSTAIVTHVDKEGNRSRYREVWDTKTENSVRDIPILPETKALLKEHRSKQFRYFAERNLPVPMYVFTTKTGSMIDATNLSTSFSRLLKRAGIQHHRFHAIRHTFATEAIRRGVDVKDLQLLLGHSDIETTYVYVQSDTESKRNAIEKMGSVM